MKIPKIANYIAIIALYIVIYLLFGHKSGNMLIDFSRESFIPYKMLEGGILFKDIFVIYGIFGYIINAIVYKIHLNINSIILLSNLISLSIVFLYFKISKIFIKNKFAIFVLIYGFISISIFSNSTFSFTVPYSYSTLWAVFGIYLTLYSLLNNNNKLTYFSLGLILANRLEFFAPALLFTLIYQLKNKIKFSRDTLFIAICPLINIIYLIANHITINDLLKNYHYIASMLEAPTLTYLYKSMGAYFEPKNFIINLFIILCLTISVKIITLKKIRLLGYIGILLILIKLNPDEVLNLIFFPLAIYTAFNFKKLNKEELLLFVFGTIPCLKSIFKAGSLSYGNFSFFLLLLYMFIVLYKLFNNQYKHPTILMILYIVLCNLVNFLYMHFDMKYPVKTNVGTIYLRDYEKESFNLVTDFLNKNLSDNNKTLLIAPEGEIFNLIFKRPHKFYNSTFTPLDFEAFGENYMIQEIKDKKPDYIVLFPRNTQEYGKSRICYNYAIDFCTYITDNYKSPTILKSKYDILIYERDNK